MKTIFKILLCIILLSTIVFTQNKQDCYVENFVVPGIHIENLSAILGKPIKSEDRFFRIFKKDATYWVYRNVIWRIEYKKELNCPFDENGFYYDDWHHVQVIKTKSYTSVTRRDWYLIILSDINVIKTTKK